MANDNDDIQVKAKANIAAIIRAVKPKAKVYPYWVIGQGLEQSVPYFLSSTEDEWGSSPFLHAYIIGYDDDTRTRTGTASFTDETTYKLWGFYGFKLGNEAKNSEDVFSVHVKQIQNALTAATKLQYTDHPDGVPEVKNHGEWQISSRGVYYMGQQKVHIAQGSITVYPRLIINMAAIA